MLPPVILLHTKTLSSSGYIRIREQRVSEKITVHQKTPIPFRILCSKLPPISNRGENLDPSGT